MYVKQRGLFAREKGGRLLNSAEASWLHTLYITYAETLYRIACYRLQDANRAQDLLHSVFLAAAQKVPALQALHPSPAGLAPTPPPSLGLAEVLPVQLSPRDREILLLFYEEGLSYQEIAQRLGVPVSTCGTWLSRARKHCRAYLSHSPGFPD